MSYCIFENTYEYLEACWEKIDDKLSESEKLYRKKVIELCKEIAEYCVEDE